MQLKKGHYIGKFSKVKSYSESVNFAVSKSVRRGLSEQTYLMYIPILIFIHGYSLKHMLHFHYINYFIIMCRSCSSSLLFLIKKICVSMYGVPAVCVRIPQKNGMALVYIFL